MVEDFPQPVTYGPLTRSDLVRYAGASGDFNPLHHDHEYAIKAGLPDVMAHGMLSAGLLASALTQWFGAGSVLRYAVRFRNPVWPGDVLVATCTGMSAADKGTDLTLELTSGDGTVVLSAIATISAQRQTQAS
jgi:3-hydroxybutyryl-CoA dehydratase